MRTVSALLVLAAFLAPGTVLADTHLVSDGVIAARVAKAATTRQRDIGTLDRMLASPAAVEAAARLGVDAGRLRTSLAALDASEARDLAARAAALGLDPAAGEDWDTNDILTVFLVVAIVILVLDAVN
ncbi:MAG TPA: hypothetical protein VFM88_20995 [Vicinamibacteria bacterium]|nr:hypothetical protein [Vicinamibacteria bacterium]